MPDDILTSRESNVVASYWRQYDATDDAETRAILRQLIEKTYVAAAYRRLTADLKQFHAQRREDDKQAERKRG